MKSYVEFSSWLFQLVFKNESEPLSNTNVKICQNHNDCSELPTDSNGELNAIFAYEGDNDYLSLTVSLKIYIHLHFSLLNSLKKYLK